MFPETQVNSGSQFSTLDLDWLNGASTSSLLHGSTASGIDLSLSISKFIDIKLFCCFSSSFMLENGGANGLVGRVFDERSVVRIIRREGIRG